MRCNPFDVLPGTRSLSMEESTCLDSGALTLLAGVLRYNTTLTELNLADLFTKIVKLATLESHFKYITGMDLEYSV